MEGASEEVRTRRVGAWRCGGPEFEKLRAQGLGTEEWGPEGWGGRSVGERRVGPRVWELSYETLAFGAAGVSHDSP